MARSTRFPTFKVIQYTVLIVVCLLMMAPVLTAFLGSIRTTGEFLSKPFGLPETGIHWENYEGILTGSSFWTSLKNSVVITVGVTILNVICASLLAFIFPAVDFSPAGFFPEQQVHG